MIRIASIDDARPVIRFELARKLAGWSYYQTAAYWVDGLLIDTGCAHTASQFTSALRSLQVSQVANTHSHEDHIGANSGVQEEFGCPILAHPDALPILQDPRLQPLQPYRLLFWGRPRPSQGTPIGDRLETERFRFQVIHTPGHSPDHICLFEPDRGWLFSGDAYIGGKDRALRAGYDIHGIITSLKKLAELPVGMIFSGSGTVRTEGRRHLKKKIAYLEELGEQIYALHKEGLAARRISRRLLGREMPIAYVTLGHFSGLRLVQSYLAGLEAPMAEHDEEVEPETDDSVAAKNAGDQPRDITST
ncbi:MAG: MBL fold metallo-hydrolase [Anaerolineae bacterium]|jgi:glyoxylase-like metal-dependent hydrolase (beta-lactamase superfamily II)